MPKRIVNADELRKLGFSEELIQEALEREKRGILDIEPPPHLSRRIIRHLRLGLARKYVYVALVLALALIMHIFIF